MATCTSCSAALEPTWKFCIRCGNPTGVVGSELVLVERAEPPATLDHGRRAATPVKPNGRVNRLAIVALVLGCIGGPPALVLGHIAISQIQKNGGRGLAIARIGTVLGYVWLGLGTYLAVYLLVGNVT